MKPPFLVRLIAVVPLTLFFWLAMAMLALVVPMAILFGEWKGWSDKIGRFR